MASQLNSPTTVADDSTIGSVAWSNPSNATVSDNVRATAAVSGSNFTHYLKATGFGFSVPAGATIDGIVVEVERSKNSAPDTVKDKSVMLVKGGVISSNDKATATAWTTTDTYASYGSSSDLWGLSFSPSDINASDFGLAFSAQRGIDPGTARVDHIRITVYYTASASVNSAFFRFM